MFICMLCAACVMVVLLQEAWGQSMGNPLDGGEPFAYQDVHLRRQVNGFGFRIIGGREEGCQVSVGKGAVTK